MYSLFGENISVLSKYNGGHNDVLVKCVKHGEFSIKASRLLDNLFGCPKCGFEHSGEVLSKPSNRKCDICGSDKLVQEFKRTGVNYCNKHYYQMSKYGYIRKGSLKDRNIIIKYDDYAEIILTNVELEEVGRAIVSLDKLEIVSEYKWYLMNSGYASTRTTGKHILLHRLIFNAKKDEEIDHKNRNRLDCRNDNLRRCSRSQNAMNSSKKSNNTSGVSGIWFNKRNNKWVAEIFANGIKYHLGEFKNKNDAIRIRRKAEEKYFDEFAPEWSDNNE